MQSFKYLKKKNKINRIIEIPNYSILEDEDILESTIL